MSSTPKYYSLIYHYSYNIGAVSVGGEVTVNAGAQDMVVAGRIVLGGVTGGA